MKSHKPFRFKQFEVFQDKCAMKVGTDGVLLGAWADTKATKSILDIGCGTGLIALMLAQRSEASITALEVDKAAANQADENVKKSPWSEQIQVLQQDFIDYHPSTSGGKFDLIVCNPPYFNAKQKRNPREQARQNISLPFSKLIEGAAKLLSEQGSLNLIIPFDESNNIQELAANNSLYAKRLMKVKGNPNTEVKRLLIEFNKKKAKAVESEIIIEKERQQYTEEYRNLLKDYLLIF